MNFLAHASSSAGNAYTVTEDGCAPLLVECGLPRQQLQRALEFKTSGLAGCLISHHHGDHARALGYVACAGVDCYMSVGTAAALGVRSHRIHQVEPRRRFDVGPWQVMPFDLRHDGRDRGAATPAVESRIRRARHLPPRESVRRWTGIRCTRRTGSRALRT
jgi:phosphoribosyl 1,2-cyclic phosphodiesterase